MFVVSSSLPGILPQPRRALPGQTLKTARPSHSLAHELWQNRGQAPPAGTCSGVWPYIDTRGSLDHGQLAGSTQTAAAELWLGLSLGPSLLTGTQRALKQLLHSDSRFAPGIAHTCHWFSWMAASIFSLWPDRIVGSVPGPLKNTSAGAFAPLTRCAHAASVCMTRGTPVEEILEKPAGSLAASHVGCKRLSATLLAVMSHLCAAHTFAHEHAGCCCTASHHITALIAQPSIPQHRASCCPLTSTKGVPWTSAGILHISMETPAAAAAHHYFLTLL